MQVNTSNVTSVSLLVRTRIG